MKTYFSNSSFGLVETYFLSRRNRVLLFEAFFLLLETMIEIMRNQFWESIFFLLVQTYLSTNASFGVAKTDFLASVNHKLFFRLVETYFLTIPSYLQRIFSLLKTVYFTWEFFPTRRKHQWYVWKPFLRDRPYFCYGENWFSS